jgi:hypothetical protein
MSPKKPNAAEIRRALPLSKYAGASGPDRILRCNLCGGDSEDLRVWREHNERDNPTDVLVFVGADHEKCSKRLEDHPRLYREETGDPGHFPALCGPCVHREGHGCRHPDLKANGGGGLRVDLTDPMRGIVCMLGRNGPIRIPRRALRCAGRSTKS